MTTFFFKPTKVISRVGDRNPSGNNYTFN